MNRLVGMLGGIFIFFCLSWLGLVAIPYFQLGKLQAQVDEDTGDVYPIAPGGLAAQGRLVYVANGCVSCHTQQVRPGFAGGDIQRKWGVRQTVARDFLYDRPLLAGTRRIGPDLANVGSRRADETWHYKHLYDPRSVSPDSIMPPFKYLFVKRKITGEKASEALDLGGKEGPGAGYEIVPTPEGRALVAYLLSLRHSHPLKEAVQEAKEEEAEKPAESSGAAAPAAAGSSVVPGAPAVAPVPVAPAVPAAPAAK